MQYWFDYSKKRKKERKKGRKLNLLGFFISTDHHGRADMFCTTEVPAPYQGDQPFNIFA